MNIYGYCRVSTKKQKIERQRENIKKLYPEAVIYEEAFTGAKISRPEFDKMIRRAELDAKQGKQVLMVFDEVSRMSRNADEGFKLYKSLYEQGIDLVFLKDSTINTTVFRKSMEHQLAIHAESSDKATDKLLNGLTKLLNDFMMDLAEEQIHKAFEQAEQELKHIHERTSDGLRVAKANGKQVGRVQGRSYKTKKATAAKERILKDSKSFGGNYPDTDLIDLLKITKKSYYKYKRELKMEQLKSAM